MSRILELPRFTPRHRRTIADAVSDPAHAYAVDARELGLEELARVAFAAQGCTSKMLGRCLRASPSAGATYPIELHLAVRSVEGLEEGLYLYSSPRPGEHHVRRVGEAPGWAQGSFSLVFSARPERTTGVYGDRGYMYVRQEVGHALEGAVLEASILGLAAQPFTAERGGEPTLCLAVGRRGERVGWQGPPGIGARPALSLEEAILRRRSTRDFLDMPVEAEALSAVLALSYRWSYPRLRPGGGLSYFAAVRRAAGVGPGVYVWDGRLKPVRSDYSPARLAAACLGQRWVREAPAVVVLASSTGDGLAEVESGMAGQCIYLSSTSLGLGAVAVGAFYEDEVASVLGVEERPLYVLPVGRPA